MQQQQQNGLNDQDIQVLIKITLLTPISSNKTITIFIPYLRKFCPKVLLSSNISTFIPLFHTIHFQASSESINQSAIIDLTPILNNPTHVHYLTIQTYNKQSKGSTYSLHVQFAQMIVRAKEPNHLSVSLRKVALMAKESRASQMSLQIKVSHGATWRSKPMPTAQLAQFEESPTIAYHSLLDSVSIHLYREKEKFCEAKRFIFQFLGEGSRVIDLQSQGIKKASLKVSIHPEFNLILLDNP